MDTAGAQLKFGTPVQLPCPAAAQNPGQAPQETPTTQPCSPAEFFDLRQRATIPKGKCVYIQSGDPSDFDGYLIGTGGAILAEHTADMYFVVVIPERRACSDRNETDSNKHVQAFSEQVLSTSGRLFRRLCPTSFIVRGPLNTRNIIPLKFMFSEPEKYGPLLDAEKLEPIRWRSVADLASLINDESVTSVIIDMNGSIGYLGKLMGLCPQLGPKIKASGVPITIMAGVLAEAPTTTLRVPGRDPRSTMNAIYSSAAVHKLLALASEHCIPVLFVTNNTCNEVMRFHDAEDIVEQFELSGLLKDLALVWYGPHLKGKCVPFDWVSFLAMLLHDRYPHLSRLQRRQLWVGHGDPSILVLRNPGLEDTDIVRENLTNTELWGEVECIRSVDREAMLGLAKFVSSRSLILRSCSLDYGRGSVSSAQPQLGGGGGFKRATWDGFSGGRPGRGGTDSPEPSPSEGSGSPLGRHAPGDPSGSSSHLNGLVGRKNSGTSGGGGGSGSPLLRGQSAAAAAMSTAGSQEVPAAAAAALDEAGGGGHLVPGSPQSEAPPQPELYLDRAVRSGSGRGLGTCP